MRPLARRTQTPKPTSSTSCHHQKTCVHTACRRTYAVQALCFNRQFFPRLHQRRALSGSSPQSVKYRAVATDLTLISGLFSINQFVSLPPWRAHRVLALNVHDRARRLMPHRTPCTQSAYDRARRFVTHRTPCTESADDRVDKRYTPCTSSVASPRARMAPLSEGLSSAS